MSAQPATSKQSSYPEPDLRLDAAIDRLRRATGTLEAALSRRERESKSRADLEQELEVLLQDRSRLAQELDQVKAKASRLDAAGAEVSGRLDAVMASLQSLLVRA